MLLLVLLINFLLNTSLVVFQMRSISSRSRVHGTPFTSTHKIWWSIDSLVLLNRIISLFQFHCKFRLLLANLFEQIFGTFQLIFLGKRVQIVVQGFLVLHVFPRGRVQLRIVVRDNFVQRIDRLLAIVKRQLFILSHLNQGFDLVFLLHNTLLTFLSDFC